MSRLTIKKPARAACLLLVATVGWGLSFPTMKALELSQRYLLPHADSWFFTALSVLIRFGVAALIVFFFCLKTLRNMTRRELSQGAGLALFGSFGLLLQMDGLVYTDASTSAFLTQCYCLFIPVLVAVRRRQLPPVIILVCTIMVTSGVAILSRFNWHEMHLGRGEWETLMASLFFTGQILWLERPAFAENNVNHTTAVMFALSALIALPLIFFTAGDPANIIRAYSTLAPAVFVGILTFICTLGSYVLMNHWQPHLEASQAGLIYCAEPVFASVFALFIPGIFSALAKIDYRNESMTQNLVAGGGLITAANILILWQAARMSRNARLNRGAAKTFDTAR